MKLEKLGEGSFGQIWLVRSTQKGGTFVLKEMALGRLSAKEVAACRLEVDVLKRFDHPSIITFVSSFEEPGMLGIIMEYASSGDLQRLIDERVADGHAHLPEWRVKAYALQLGHAVHYLHTHMLLLHRDIKPANVFLAPSGEVRLGDFGMCRLIPCSRINMIPREDARAKPRKPSDTGSAAKQPAKPAPSSNVRPYANAVGTPLYMSPEHISGAPFDTHDDMWAYGCTIFELMALAPPWSELMDDRGGLMYGMDGLLEALTTTALNMAPLKPRFSPTLCALLGALLQRSLQRRTPLDTFLEQLKRVHAPVTPDAPPSTGAPVPDVAPDASDTAASDAVPDAAPDAGTPGDAALAAAPVAAPDAPTVSAAAAPAPSIAPDSPVAQAEVTASGGEPVACGGGSTLDECELLPDVSDEDSAALRAGDARPSGSAADGHQGPAMGLAIGT